MRILGLLGLMGLVVVGCGKEIEVVKKDND